MTRRLESIVVAAALAFAANPAAAWSNHTLGAWPALAAMPEVSAAPAIRVESLDAFLAAEARGLEQLLRREEAWARANVPLYPARPDALAFTPGGNPMRWRAPPTGCWNRVCRASTSPIQATSWAKPSHNSIYTAS